MNAWGIEPIIARQDAIMSRYDPDHKLGLIIDEWGCWYDVEKGTNPAFLYQQNTMRDAITAAINLHIFNDHSDRIVMANIAQTVNVLQSVILTEGEKMVLTPTYYVFKMLRDHQDADLVESYITSSDCDGYNIPAVTKSVSVDKNGDMLITLANCTLNEECVMNISTGSFNASDLSAEILTADIHAYNGFDGAENVKPVSFDGVSVNGNKVGLTLPPHSVVSVKLTK
ncbi:MAG: alpha-L-arabinofuranosidase C-terminal domain-containing protein [Huintestinicola sp.]